MTENLSPAARSRVMASIRSDGTRPERAARLMARLSGLDYRVNARDLPGSPDVVFDAERVALFVHGCFWHRHAACGRGRSLPSTHRAFWERKFERNCRRDRRAYRRLRELGWTVEVLWECEL